MLAGIEFILSIAAIGLGIAMLVLGVKRRPAPAGQLPADDSTTTILRANVYSLTVIALMFFGVCFLIDTFM